MRHTRKSVSKKQWNCRKIILIVAIALAVIAAAVFTFSRYKTTLESTQVLVPENFYFESNYLTEVVVGSNDATDSTSDAVTIGTVYTYNVYTDSVEIEIRNHDLIQAADNNITYTITYSTSDEDTTATLTTTVDGVDGEDEESTVASGSEYTLAHTSTINGEGTSEEIEFATDTFTLTADEGATVTVTATSSDPYEKTITAIFQFQDAGNKTFYEVVDMGYYCYLNIYTGEDIADLVPEGDDTNAYITIEYITQMFSPDNMDPMMEDWKIVSLYEYDTDGNIQYDDSSGEIVWSSEAEATLTETIAIYQGDTGTDASNENYTAPTDTELVPNGFYSLVFFENTLADYVAGQIILGENGDYTIDLTDLATKTESED